MAYPLLSFALLFSVYALNNFKLIMFHDSPYPLNSNLLASSFSYVWRDIANFGYYDPTGTPLAIFYFLISLFETITKNLVASEFLFLFLISQLTLFSSFFLAKEVGLDNKYSILSSFLYLMNPYSLYYVWRILNANIFLYAIYPLFFLSAIKILQGHKIKGLSFLILSGTIALPAFANPAWFLTLSFSLLIFSFALGITLGINLPVLLRRISSIILLLIVFVLPIYGNYLLRGGQHYISQEPLQTSSKLYEFNTQNINIINLFSLTSLPPVHEEITWYNFQNLYVTNPLSLIIGLFIAILVFSPLFKKDDKFKLKILPFLILFTSIIIFIFHNAFSKAILERLPMVLALLRDPSHKLGLITAIVLCIMIPYGFQNLASFFNKRIIIKAMLIISLIITLIFMFYPFITLSFIPCSVVRENQTFSAFSSVPSEYCPVINYLYADKNFNKEEDRVLIYPLTNILWWEDNYWGNDILRFNGIRTISTFSHINLESQNEFLSNLQDVEIIKDERYVDFLSKLSVKYILVRKKACEPYLQKLAIEIKEILEERHDVQKIVETDRYALFKLNLKTNSVFSIFTIPKTSKSFSLPLNKLEMSVPGFFNWSLIKNENLVMLLPIDNPKNVTWIDINPFEVCNSMIYDHFRINIEIANTSEIKSLYVSYIFADGSTSGVIFPYNCSVINEKELVYNFALNKISIAGICLNNIIRMFITFEVDTPRTIIVKECNFYSPEISYDDLLNSQSLRTITKINPTKWNAKINSTEPFILVFAESYDSMWVCYVNGKKVNSVPLYGAINGFRIYQTGLLDITIEYEPQKWLYICSIISATIIIACIIYIVYDWTKKITLVARIQRRL